MADRTLPVYEIESELVAALSEDNRLVLQAPTGSGKSTQVPQMLVDHGLVGDKQVVVLQPRRMAARLLATHVASERGMPLGDEIGYTVRFENRTSVHTRVRYETEGLLMRQMMSDPMLEGVGAIIFDEFHERHVHGDLTLALARELQKTRRPDLKLIVMSATLDAGAAQSYLDDCSLLSSEGRTFPVEITYYAKGQGWKDLPAWEKAVKGFEYARESGYDGDVLIFMPGGYEISKTVQALGYSSAARGHVVLPLHGELSNQDQDAAVARYSQPKIVVATNVAETSLTIDGIRVVIDSGLARKADFDPHRGINTLLIERISQASADQRAGRAGRTAPGQCIRLWSEREHQSRLRQEDPEIKRIDLSEVLLGLKAQFNQSLAQFPWFEPPDEHALERAVQLLCDLGALRSRDKQLTDLGRRMAQFPVHPRYARMLIEAGRLGCVQPVVLAAALSQSRPVLVRTRDQQVLRAREESLGEVADSDFFIQMRAWHYARSKQFKTDACRRLGIHAGAARQVQPVMQQFLRLAKQQGIPVEDRLEDEDALKKCLLAGFSDQVAVRRSDTTRRCDLVHKRRGEIARESVVAHAPLVVATEISEIESSSRQLNVLLNQVTAIKESWLQELFPDDFSTGRSAVFDSAARKVVARECTRFRDLVLREKPLHGEVDEVLAAELLAGEVLQGNLKLKKWDASVEKWKQRIRFLHRTCPEMGFPDCSEDDVRLLIEQVCLGAASYRQIKDRDPWPVLREYLSSMHQPMLEQGAPEHIQLPSGRRAKVMYPDNGPPYVAARIQDLYGLEDGFKIAFGKHDLLIHVLAPSHRPVQMTTNLKSFWSETYPKVKSELQRKYPKHEWR